MARIISSPTTVAWLRLLLLLTGSLAWAGDPATLLPAADAPAPLQIPAATTHPVGHLSPQAPTLASPMTFRRLAVASDLDFAWTSSPALPGQGSWLSSMPEWSSSTPASDPVFQEETAGFPALGSARFFRVRLARIPPGADFTGVASSAARTATIIRYAPSEALLPPAIAFPNSLPQLW